MYFIVQDKISLARILNVSDKTLHVVVGVALYVLFLKLLKHPGRAVLAVFCVELVNEINDAVVAYPYWTHAFWADTSTDILATMVLPCLIAGWRMFRHGGWPHASRGRTGQRFTQLSGRHRNDRSVEHFSPGGRENMCSSGDVAGVDEQEDK